MAEETVDPRIRFTVALIEDLKERAREDIALLPFLAPLIQGLRNGFPEQPVAHPSPSPDGFDVVVSGMTASQELAHSLPEIAAQGRWVPVVAEHPDVDPLLQAGMKALHVYGSHGLLGCERMRGGLFLLSPGIHYPLHTHVPTELYYCLSGELMIQHGTEGTTFSLTPGHYSITPRERTHALTTGDEPVLLYFSWVGDFTTPIYWWDKPEDGVWRRAKWTRTESGTWERGAMEPIPEEIVETQS